MAKTEPAESKDVFAFRWMNGGMQITEDSVSECEQIIGRQLPADYIKIILKHDGGIPEANVIRLNSGNEELFSNFLPVASNDAIGLVQTYKRLVLQGADPALVPFARDSCGNYFCFLYTGAGKTEVVFWDHETNTSERICATVTELLGMLYEIE